MGKKAYLKKHRIENECPCFQNSLIMTITKWPEAERPREKLLARGASHLSNAELLALLFGSGIQGKSAVDLARELLNKFEGLRGLFSASFQEFQTIRGLGLSKYCQCQAILELNRRCSEESLKRADKMTSAQAVKHFLKNELREYRQEIFACLFLDNHHRMITFEKLFYGTIDTATVHPRILIERTLYHNAAAIILAHNHPSGSAEPSLADREITKILFEALALIDVRLLDHFIIGDQQITSLSEEGPLA